MQQHKCMSAPCCLNIGNRMSAGEDTWFCVHGTKIVRIHRLPGLTMGASMNESSQYLVEVTYRDTKRIKTETACTAEEVQEICLRHLRACPHLAATLVVRSGSTTGCVERRQENGHVRAGTR